MLIILLLIRQFEPWSPLRRCSVAAVAAIITVICNVGISALQTLAFSYRIIAAHSICMFTHRVLWHFIARTFEAIDGMRVCEAATLFPICGRRTERERHATKEN